LQVIHIVSLIPFSPISAKCAAPVAWYLRAMGIMVDQACARRIEQNRARSACDYATEHRARFPEHGAEVLAVAGGFAVWSTPFGAPSMSKAFALGTGGPVDADDLARIEDFYARRSAPTRLTVCPWADPSLFENLAIRGYRVVDFENILSRLLGASEPFASPASGVAVARVGPGEVRAWGRLVRAGFGMDADDPRSATMDSVFEGSAHAALFVATVDGEPAGGAGLLLYDGIATLFAAGTIPRLRRRGVQGALVAARLEHARQTGADLAIAITDPGSDSQRNLEERFAFRVGYTSVVFEGRSGE
jgi:GNAT superfamily N-acetyltransferase